VAEWIALAPLTHKARVRVPAEPKIFIKLIRWFVFLIVFVCILLDKTFSSQPFQLPVKSKESNWLKVCFDCQNLLQEDWKNCLLECYAVLSETDLTNMWTDVGRKLSTLSEFVDFARTLLVQAGSKACQQFYLPSMNRMNTDVNLWIKRWYTHKICTTLCNSASNLFQRDTHSKPNYLNFDLRFGL